MDKIKVLVACNDKKVIDQLSFSLGSSSPLVIVTEGCTSGEVASMTEITVPDIMLFHMPQASKAAFAIISGTSTANPQAGIIVISAPPIIKIAMKAIQCGAKGYLTRYSSKDELILCIQRINEGGKYFCEEIKALILDTYLDS